MLAVSFLLMPLKATADIYKCENSKNEIFYNDKPCPVLDKETEFSAVKDPKNGYVFPAFVVDKNKEALIKQKNIKTTQANTKDKDKDKEEIENAKGNENKVKKSKSGGNGSDLQENVQNNNPLVSSSGRTIAKSSNRAPYNEKDRVMMKVGKGMGEPRDKANQSALKNK